MPTVRLAALVLFACALPAHARELRIAQAYDGAPRPDTELGFLSTIGMDESGSVGMYVVKVDGRKIHGDSAEIGLLPGRHSIRMRAMGQGAHGWQVAERIEHELDVVAGHAYLFMPERAGSDAVTVRFVDMGTNFDRDCMPLRTRNEGRFGIVAGACTQPDPAPEAPTD